MASMTMTKASKCPECGKVHDCAFYVEMQMFNQRLSKEIDRLVESVKETYSIPSTPEIHPMEDK